MTKHLKVLSKITIKGWHAKFMNLKKQTISEKIKLNLGSDKKSSRED